MPKEFSASKATAEFCTGVTFEDLPKETVDFIKKDILDWLGCAIGGSASDFSLPAKKLITSLGGAKQSLAFGLGAVNVRDAAFFNGYCGHILEMDDVDRESISHPATVNIAPALAAAQYVNKSGKDFMLASVCGFEAMLRIGAAITPAHYEIFHTTSTAGNFGAAMAAGKIFDLNNQEMLWALGNAGTLSGGLWQFNQNAAMSKFLHTGSAASNGVVCALLAKNQFSGATEILEGSQGFFAGFARQEINEALFKDYGRLWRTPLVSFKPYPCCRHTHSAIDAAMEVRAKLNGKDETITEITLLTYEAADLIAGNRAPKTTREAKFSTAYCVANTILNGKPAEKSFNLESISKEDVRNLEAMVKVVIDPEINKQLPYFWPAKIVVKTDKGNVYTGESLTPKGDPENTLTWDEVTDKFKSLTEGILESEVQTLISETVFNLESVSNVNELTDIIASNMCA